MIIFRFTEISGKEDGGEIVKILGPLKRMGDGSFFPGINKVTYGPKKLSSDVLSVEINVIELDAGERATSTALLDFIANAASTLAIADPVTQGEIKVAKEIASTLLQFNQNDPVMDIHFDLLPYDENVEHWSSNSDVSPIPLKTGNYVIIQEEQCRFMGCYFQFTEKNESEIPTYLLSIPADIITTPLVALNRTFLDKPDKRALSPINIDKHGKIKTRGNFLLLDNDTKKLYLNKMSSNSVNTGTTTEKIIYTDKSWITFSIEQGRDPSLWEFRKSLSESEEEINELLKNKSITEILESSQVDDIITKLNKTKEEIKAIKEMKRKLKHLLASASYIEDLNSKETQRFCVSKPKDSIIKYINFSGAGKLDISDSTHKQIEVERSDDTPSEECYTIKKGENTIIEGKYKIHFQVKKPNSEHFESHTVDYYFVSKPKFSKSSTSGDKNEYELTMYNKVIDKIIVKVGDVETKDFTISDKENSKKISIPKITPANKFVIKMKFGLKDQECTLPSGDCK